MHAHNGPHDGILLLEEHIEELHAKIESCQKFILASRIAVVGGGIRLPPARHKEAPATEITRASALGWLVCAGRVLRSLNGELCRRSSEVGQARKKPRRLPGVKNHADLTNAGRQTPTLPQRA